jgi:hypothetical protein
LSNSIEVIFKEDKIFVKRSYWLSHPIQSDIALFPYCNKTFLYLVLYSRRLLSCIAGSPVFAITLGLAIPTIAI